MSEERFLLQRYGQPEGPFTVEQLRDMARSKQLRSSALVGRQEGSWFPVTEVPGVFSDKEWLTALMLSIFLGGLGGDRFYLGHTGLAIIKLCTLGACGFWSIMDVILLATNGLSDGNGLPLRRP